MGHESPAQYNPADYVMDLVNQDMKVREELKEAYAQNRTIMNEKKPADQLSQQYSSEGIQYLIRTEARKDRIAAIDLAGHL